MTAGRRERESEELLEFHEVGYEMTFAEEADETEGVDEEDEGGDGVKAALLSLRHAGGVVLRLEGGVESLIGWRIGWPGHEIFLCEWHVDST